MVSRLGFVSNFAILRTVGGLAAALEYKLHFGPTFPALIALSTFTFLIFARKASEDSPSSHLDRRYAGFYRCGRWLVTRGH